MKQITNTQEEMSNLFKIFDDMRIEKILYHISNELESQARYRWVESFMVAALWVLVIILLIAGSCGA